MEKLPSAVENFEKSGEPSAKYAHLYPIADWKAGWYDDEYDKIVNHYWMEFPPPPPEAHYAFAAVYFILTVVSLCGNSLVFYLIVRCKSLRTPSNVLVANLAVADFFMMSRGPIFIYNCLNFGPITGYIGCQLYGVVGGLTGVAASASLAFIACDRCSVIVHTFDPQHKLTYRRAALTVTLIWLYAAFFATLPFTGRRFGIKPYVPEGYLTSCSFDYVSDSLANRIFILVFFFGAWCVPFSIITSSYYKICRHVLDSSLTRIGQERQQRKGELRLAILVVLMIAIWFLSWTPYAVVALTGISGNRRLLTPLLTMLPAVFCKTAATIDPFLYALSHPRFRREVLRMWCRKALEKQRAKRAMQNHMAIWRSDGSLRNDRNA
ncbi:unnamed protein product [Nesidiocoris tenuis]|nr:unnamed protein product [Nesidiocoris tenuis]